MALTNFGKEYFLKFLAAGKMKSTGASGSEQSDPKNWYLGLSTSSPAADGTGVSEPPKTSGGNDTGYERQLISGPVANWSASNDMSVKGSDDTFWQLQADHSIKFVKKIIYFPECLVAWGNCQYFVIYDAQTNGNLIAYGALTQAISPIPDTIPIIRHGDISISLT